MDITVLNGNPARSELDQYLTQVTQSLEAKGHRVTQVDLRDLSLRPCVGCWGCWVKTPGECISRDASLEIDRAVINADFVLWAAPLIMGFPSALLKMALDKHLPLIHPYTVVDHGEAHHLKRYKKYPRFGLILKKEASTDARDMQIVKDILSRTALNFKSRLEFSLSTEISPEELTHHITGRAKSLPLPPYRLAVPGVIIKPPTRLTLFNGSPRGRRGNTPIMLTEFAKGFGGGSETHHLIQLKQIDNHIQAFADAECAFIGFPLYTDAMPGSVKKFFESLESLVGRQNNPPVGFLVQSGFPEGLHSRYVERYLEKLASRLGSPYLGTIVRGNGEGLRLMPPEMTRDLFADLQALGAGLARDGRLDGELLTSMAKPERFRTILQPIWRILLMLPNSQSYFDGMLKKNGAYEHRFARPFLEELGK